MVFSIIHHNNRVRVRNSIPFLNYLCIRVGLRVRVSVSLKFLPLHCPLANDAKVARSNCLRAVPNCLSL